MHIQEDLNIFPCEKEVPFLAFFPDGVQHHEFLRQGTVAVQTGSCMVHPGRIMMLSYNII